MTHTSYKKFETLSWLPVTERFNQYIDLVVLNYVNDQCPNNLNAVSQTAPKIIFRVEYISKSQNTLYTKPT